MSTTIRGNISVRLRVISVCALALGMTLSLIIASGIQQRVVAQIDTGVIQNNTTKIIRNSNGSTVTSGLQQQSQLDSIADSQFMMLLSNANPWVPMTGQYDMMNMMTNMMDNMANMMMPSLSMTEGSSNSSDMMTNSMQGP